ncbi:hypothetical protein A2303_02885 [Candidatus Falkowbacteria bacterium RIFOXYB2_FULL_47_14]|uniref:Penicillin-binding protein transpeptidase domain-containing protein n=1 Tax=Candidatus Falkowbacteria bacterium RIFOXYA2_FULL_47_19 TaxID=1797994 RepID=A0A1F5SLQ6_9BACT|nr:MAG: hypothetical protein A2227_01960 [Candidatus Falkowbacteria bacterium RIFOXYA2_FULL_47_19]OGF36262.1 MAG: hypothetical protein A2468_07630 [Candidatus Falkowbacteria bacterium RIFOXYC2_FULL_46_15]OGF43066.1 MAG: hypothetical protein A2303_02885 [Candidatus Falkowbacteria bacterium RIFOXYB2_FULL_47_14]
MISSKYNRKKSDNGNRLNLVMTVIFLLAGSILLRLYGLQVSKNDLYVALASDQHQVYNKLQPSRGEIYIQNSPVPDGKDFYPVATNKDFALVYAIPKDVKSPAEAADRLYEIFDRKNVEDEVDKMLKEDPYFSATSSDGLGIAAADIKNREEFKAIKRELELETRKKSIVAAYLDKLSKENDPYEPIRYKVEKETLDPYIDELHGLGIDHIMEAYRYYPEFSIGSHLFGFVGFDDSGKIGRYGLENFFNEELTGAPGSIKAERSGNGSLIIVNDREFNEPKNGSDLILTINRSIQFNACQKLNAAALRHGADGGTVIVMEPKTGAIIAMCSWPDYDPNNYGKVDDISIYNNPAVFDQYEPGSIFKIFTMSAGIDQGKVTPESTYNDKGSIKIPGWSKPIKNSDFDTFGGHGTVDMITVLELSLNTGSIHVMQRTGPEVFADYVKKFGFGQKTGIELPGEGSGNIVNLERDVIRPVEVATATFGQGITVTPLQTITAYAAVVNGGILMKPYVVDEIVTSEGERIKTQPQPVRRVISERTSLLLSGMMVRVVEEGHSTRAAVKGYYVGGKTGTAQVAGSGTKGYEAGRTIHTFIGFAPADDPKFVMLVKLNDPKDVAWADSSTAPLFSEIAEFILNYYQVPKER